tara:strand:+ start:1643 stop:2482 length:840 start_codon:yes stop_codon:yes gene_type:complete
MEIHQTRPVFICGCMRTGTTILQRIICSAEDLGNMKGECFWITDQMDSFQQLQNNFVNRLADYFKNENEYENYTKKLIENFILRDCANDKTNRPVYKNPELTFHIPTLVKWFQFSDIVISIRDPRDTICSFIEIIEKHNKNNISSRLSKIGRDIDILCDHYFFYYKKFFKDFNYLKNKCLVIKYEDIVNKNDKTINYLSEGLSVKIDLKSDDVLKSKINNSISYNKNLRESFSSAFWSDEYLEKINNKKVGIFKKKLDVEEIRIIENKFQDFNNFFKYW